MASDNPLEPIWRTYQVTRDCLKIAQRTVQRADTRLLRGTDFMGDLSQASTERIQRSRNESDDFVILSLWVAFERIVLSFLREKGRGLLTVQPPSLARELYRKFESDIEYGKVEDLLGLFKQDIDAHLIGALKNVKRHRDWIAHRNPRRPSPGAVTPVFAYRILSEILEHIGRL
jgi:hypothetical protein